jgi:hypothetical protein
MFLHGVLEKEVYMKQPLGFENSQNPHYIYASFIKLFMVLSKLLEHGILD